MHITRLRGKKGPEIDKEEEGMTEDVGGRGARDCVRESHEEGRWRGLTRGRLERGCDTQDEGWRKIQDGA